MGRFRLRGLTSRRVRVFDRDLVTSRSPDEVDPVSVGLRPGDAESIWSSVVDFYDTGFHPALAPIKATVLPLSKKLAEPARAIQADLRKHFNTFYDDAGNIGRRYRRQDEVGTPYCVTYDFESADDGCVTIRDRDTMSQERVPTEGLVRYLRDRLEEVQ